MAKKDNPKAAAPRVLGQGRYLTLFDEGGWEYVTRPHISGVVVIVAVTTQGKLLLVEQYRTAVHKRVIELPAGLVGDEQDHGEESLADAADRELVEETGYKAGKLVRVGEGPIAVGVSDEVVTFFQASDLSRVGPGGGVDKEQITVHEVTARELTAFLDAGRAQGLAVDPKIFAGLFMAGIVVPR